MVVDDGPHCWILLCALTNVAQSICSSWLSPGIGRRTALVLVGTCNGGSAAQACESPTRHNASVSTVGSPWLVTPQVPSVVWMLAGALVSPWGSKLPCQQLPGLLAIWPSARSPLVTLPKKPLSLRKLSATSLP